MMFQSILSEIMVELHKEGVLLLGERDVDAVMKDHLNREFVLVPVKQQGVVFGHNWWIKHTE